MTAIQDRQGTHDVQQVMELLDVLREQAKERLMTCSLTDFNSLQGEAQAYDKLIRMLRRPVVALTAAQEA